MLVIEMAETLISMPLTGLLAWLKEHEYLVTTFIALSTLTCALVGLFAVRENLQTDRIRFWRLSPDAKDVVKALSESGWKGAIRIDYRETGHYIELEVEYSNGEGSSPYPSGVMMGGWFHFALLELRERGFLERQMDNFFLTNQGNDFVEKFRSRLLKHSYQELTCFEDRYKPALNKYRAST